MGKTWVIFVLCPVLVVNATVFLDGLRTFSQDLAHLLPHHNVSKQCQKHVNIIINEANQLKLWALQIVDASAKLPSGLLQGNLNQLGDFDLCLSAKGTYGRDTIQGQYCLAEIALELDESLKFVNERLHAYRVLTSNITDPGQRIPKLNSWRWGICLPSTCTPNELQLYLEELLDKHLKGLAQYQVLVNPEVCYTTNESPQFEFGFFLTTFLFTTLSILIILGTMGYQIENNKLAKYLDCFSLKRNWNSLWKTDNDSDDIDIVHGARFLSAIGLLLAHKQIAQLYNPYINSVTVANTIDGGWTMIGRSAILYTDTFIVVSGLLTTRALLKDLQAKGKIDIFKHIVTRYLRFTPNLAVVILTSTYLMDVFGSGPQWGQVVAKYSDICRNKMWRNFLYIHNFYGFEEMCLTHTHQLGLDMQLFLMSPFLAILLWKFPKLGTIIIGLIASASTWLRYTVTFNERLSPVVYYGISVDQLYKTARLSYILPTHRITVYAIGIILGYCYRNGTLTLNMRPWTVCVGWAISLMMGLTAMFGPYHMAKRGYVYNAYDAALYSAFAPLLWCSFLIWTVVACHNGKGGWFHTLLSWKYYNVFSRISYAVYLVQFPVFFYNVGTQRTALFYKGFSSIVEIPEFLAIFVLAVLLTLLVDMPFQNVRKILYGRSSKTVVENEMQISGKDNDSYRQYRKIKFG